MAQLCKNDLVALLTTYIETRIWITNFYQCYLAYFVGLVYQRED